MEGENQDRVLRWSVDDSSCFKFSAGRERAWYGFGLKHSSLSNLDIWNTKWRSGSTTANYWNPQNPLWLLVLIVKIPNMPQYALIRTVESVLALPQKLTSTFFLFSVLGDSANTVPSYIAVWYFKGAFSFECFWYPPRKYLWRCNSLKNLPISRGPVLIWRRLSDAFSQQIWELFRVSWINSAWHLF